MTKPLVRTLLIYSLLGFGAHVSAATDTDDIEYLTLSLKDLLNVKINTGSLIEAAEKESAAGITIITKTASGNNPNFSVGVAQNDTYRSDGINLQFSNLFDQLGVYGSASYRLLGQKRR